MTREEALNNSPTAYEFRIMDRSGEEIFRSFDAEETASKLYELRDLFVVTEDGNEVFNCIDDEETIGNYAIYGNRVARLEHRCHSKNPLFYPVGEWVGRMTVRQFLNFYGCIK